MNRNNTLICAILLAFSLGYIFRTPTYIPPQEQPKLRFNALTHKHPTDASSSDNIVFFHMHLVKTAGSTLNRYMARKYYGVCGHKGYSSDQPLHIGDKPREGKDGEIWGPDLVDFGDMDDRGWHNCKLISHESWAELSVSIIKYMQELGFSMHALIPCRDPVSHTISKCSHLERDLASWSKHNNDSELCHLINTRCDLEEDRFNESIIAVANSSTFYWYKNFTEIDEEIVRDHMPLRPFVLPEHTGKYKTNEPYPNEVVREVVQRCGTQIHEYKMKDPYYKMCAQSVPLVDQVPDV